jgi:hypothetical protein
LWRQQRLHELLQPLRIVEVQVAHLQPGRPNMCMASCTRVADEQAIYDKLMSFFFCAPANMYMHQAQDASTGALPQRRQ